MRIQNEKNAAREKRAVFLAEEILNDVRGRVLLHLPYLSEAVMKLALCGEGVPEGFSFGTDGSCLFFDPAFIFRLWKADEKEAARDYLHSLLHCLFRHPFCDARTALPGSREKWNLACDIAAEAVLCGLGLDFIKTKREAEEFPMIALLKEEIGEPLTAERIFRYLERRGFSEEELRAERMHFLGDGHGLWYRSANPELYFPEEKKAWENTAANTAFSAEEMEEPENILVRGLKRSRKKRLSYADLIRKFLGRGEILQTADEFDYIYYTYGLSIYRNTPLIEPLEYREDDRIRSVAVAVDTSGSVPDEVVRTFLRHTCELLFNESLFSDRLEIRILQCDDRIRGEMTIGSREELREQMGKWKIAGRGGTDFRPVFSYLQTLLESGKMKDFKGLLYFTDGDGIFPNEKPPFETVFVLSKEGAKVPAWAAGHVMTEEDFADE